VAQAARFRELLRHDGMIVAPGAYDGITARIIARARFECVAKAPTPKGFASNIRASGERPFRVDLRGSITVSRTAGTATKPGVQGGQGEPPGGVVSGLAPTEGTCQVCSLTARPIPAPRVPADERE
jgi:hypothetical protein